MTTATLKADASNRALRTFLTGLGIDILVGVVLVLVTFFGTANGWGDLEWTILAFSLLKSVVQAGGAYVLRRFLDPSGFPTPLPPSPVPAPAVGPGEAGVANAGGVLGALGLGLIVLAVILLVLLLLEAYAVSPIVLVVLFVLGLVLWWIGGRPGYGRGAV